MEPSPIYYSLEKFYETSSGNILGRKVVVKGSNQIALSGKSILHNTCILRADLAKISLGKYVIMKEGCIVKPSYTGGSGYNTFNIIS